MAVTLALSVDDAITNAFALMSSIARLDEARKAQAGKSYSEFGPVYELNIQTSWTILLDISNQLSTLPDEALRNRITALLSTLQDSSVYVPWSTGFRLNAILNG